MSASTMASAGALQTGVVHEARSTSAAKVRPLRAVWQLYFINLRTGVSVSHSIGLRRAVYTRGAPFAGSFWQRTVHFLRWPPLIDLTGLALG